MNKRFNLEKKYDIDVQNSINFSCSKKVTELQLLTLMLLSHFFVKMLQSSNSKEETTLLINTNFKIKLFALEFFLVNQFSPVNCNKSK